MNSLEKEIKSDKEVEINLYGEAQVGMSSAGVKAEDFLDDLKGEKE